MSLLHYDLIETWLKETNPQKFIDEMNKHKVHIFEKSNDIETSRNIFKYMPGFTNKDDYTIEFGDCATDLIKRIFYKNKSNIIITTKYEHQNVKTILQNLKNIIGSVGLEIVYVNPNEVNRDPQKFNLDIVKNQNVLIYMIGTCISSGVTHATSFFDFIKAKALDSGASSVTVVCDDVQGMYMIPRDYSHFDYVVGTAHAIIPEFGMGILIRKKCVPSLGYNYNIEEYRYLLDITMTQYKSKMMEFNYVMNEVFSDVPNVNQNKIASHFFTYTPRDGRDDMWDNIIIDKLDTSIHIEGGVDNQPKFFRFRAQDTLNDLCFIDKLHYVDELLQYYYS